MRAQWTPKRDQAAPQRADLGGDGEGGLGGGVGGGEGALQAGGNCEAASS